MSRLGSGLPDLRVRKRRAELMDDPDLQLDLHLDALRALARVNWVSLGSWRLGREVAALHEKSGAPVRVLDVACGGGDVLVRVAVAARRAGRPVVLHGCDRSPRALASARAAGKAVGLDDVSSNDDGSLLHFFEHDALLDPIPEGYDLVTSSLFLHHLAWPEAVELLRRMAAGARRRLFVQDLRRTRLGYVLAWLGLHTFSRSEVARVDGLRSVEAAFSVDEARRLCAEAALRSAVVGVAWPQRFIMRWDRAEVA
ncbi:MAG: methyltransferase domain-containing protein [Gemmatimonadetes bacterium]|nr:methyltransferase domain-containing protein [Gemmatimonadota bacterium]